MTSHRNPETSPSKRPHSGQLERIETDLERIVGSQGAQALLARSRQLCGSRAASHTLLQRTLLQLVRKLLGKPLVDWLLQSAAAVSHERPAHLHLR